MHILNRVTTVGKRFKLNELMLTALITLACTANCAWSGETLRINGRLHVCQKKLCNEKNNPIQLKGVSSHGIQLFGWQGWKGKDTKRSCLTTGSLDTLDNDWNANVLRIAMYVQQGGYATNPDAFTEQMNSLIKEAERRGMYAIVDWHILSPGDPNINLGMAEVFFKKIANDNKGRKNLLYEIANEPNGDNVDWEHTVKPYAIKLIKVIREIDPNSVIIVGNPDWSSLKFYQDIINSPLEFPNIMYTFHFYAATHGERGLTNVRNASNILPIFVTEFGIGRADGGGTNDFAMTDKYLKLFAERQISWVGWSYSDAPETSAAWKIGTCPNGPWIDSNLNPSGRYIKSKLKN